MSQPIEFPSIDDVSNLTQALSRYVNLSRTLGQQLVAKDQKIAVLEREVATLRAALGEKTSNDLSGKQPPEGAIAS